MSFGIYSKIKTTLKREEVLNELDKFLVNEFSSAKTSESTAAITSVVCKECGIDVSSSYEELQSIKKNLISSPVVKIILVTFPSSELLEVVYTHIFDSTNFGLLEITVDESIKGGIVVYRNGTVFNFSLSNLVSGLFNKVEFQQKILAYL